MRMRRHNRIQSHSCDPFLLSQATFTLFLNKNTFSIPAISKFMHAKHHSRGKDEEYHALFKFIAISGKLPWVDAITVVPMTSPFKLDVISRRKDGKEETPSRATLFQAIIIIIIIIIITKMTIMYNRRSHWTVITKTILMARKITSFVLYCQQTLI